MNKLLIDFMNKKINSHELLFKLLELSEYYCFNNAYEKGIKVLIDDIKYIVDNKDDKNDYEEVLLLLNQYIKERKNRHNKISKRWNNIN
jgi:hypothetical protein